MNDVTKSFSLQECPFCSLNNHGELIINVKNAYAIYDKFPVNQGHALIIPKRHVRDYFELSFEEQMACWDLTNKVKIILDQKYQPDGYTIGINNLFAAGQTIPHVHVHLIPRFLGDVEHPYGGVRGVIPDKKEY
ncbi:MAG: HIT family protein [Bacteroidetes bacterium]|nr:HIT family protein [Bacteroidota bacterium]